jgi:hypothetical protein
VVFALCLAVHAAGCTDVEGGAVELSWKLRAATGSEETFLTCDIGLTGTGPVTHIRLDWQVEADGDVSTGFRQWQCEDDHGVTGFQLPAGKALLRVSPVCESGAAALETYTAPAPEQRNVIVGNTISLGGVELLLEVSSCQDRPCICQ